MQDANWGTKSGVGQRTGRGGDWVGGVGEMSALVRGKDWSGTPLGPIGSWPQSLRTALGICLSSRFPMFVCWGPALITFYNDAAVAMVGEKHPEALGRPAREVWREIWEETGPQTEAVLRRGEATWNERRRLVLGRQGHPEERYFTFSYSPIPDESGGVGGLFCVASEETERVRTEAALAETRRRLDAALMAAEVGTFVWDVVADRLWGDENFGRFFAVGRDASGGVPLADFIGAIHPEDRERVREEIERSLESGEAVALEYRLKGIGGEAGAEGPWRWVIDRGKPERDATGRVVRYPGVVVDITDRKRAEEARERSLEELTRQLRIRDAFFSTTPDLAFVVDREGRLLYVNRALLELWGSKLEEVVGKKVTELPDTESWAGRVQVIIERVVGTGRAVRDEAGYASPEGWSGYYEYIFAPVLAADGTVEAVVSSTRDITDRWKVEQALRESEERLRLAAELVGLSSFEWDPSTGAVEGDARLKAMWGLPPDAEIAHDLLMDAIHPEDFPHVQAQLARALDPKDGAYAAEYRVIGIADGVERWISTRGRTFFDESGKPVRFVGTAMDITERERAAEALRQAKEAAEEADRLKDEFLAVVSHELGTPLAVILMWTKMLQAGRVPAAKLPGVYRVLTESAEAQQKLVSDLLDKSQLTTGNLRLHLREGDLAALVRAAVEAVRPMADARRVRVETALDERLGRVLLDPQRMQQVLWNLLNNAVKFSNAGGHVRVELGRTDGRVRLRVIDRGKGISPAFLPFVFERFRQADGSITRAHGGMGLGLSITRQLVELHGGTIWAESAGEGQGATFTLELPLSEVSEPGAEEGRQQDAPPGARGAAAVPPAEGSASSLAPPLLKGVRVLFVEDEAGTREVIQWALEQFGAEVVPVSSADEALERFRESLQGRRFDVLVSDVGLPERDGYDLIAAVREAEREAGETAPIPAAALTAYAGEDHRERALATGFQVHLGKPIGPDALVEAVCRLVGRPGPLTGA